MLQASLIDCGGGNLASARSALHKTAPDNMQIQVANSPDMLDDADYILMPGQGAFTKFMQELQANDWLEKLNELVIKQARPFLGICVGMQVMLQGSTEYHADEATGGYTSGLGWVSGITSKFAAYSQKDADVTRLKIPQMGWNSLNFCTEHPIFSGLDNGTDMYFVHSYGLMLADTDNASSILATSDYGQDFAAVIAHNNAIGTQFHVEKSHYEGLRLMYNFLRWKP